MRYWLSFVLYVLAVLCVLFFYGVLKMNVNSAILIIVFWLIIVVMGYLFSRDDMKKDEKVDK
jgi:L-asparagine transporter-like permease